MPDQTVKTSHLLSTLGLTLCIAISASPALAASSSHFRIGIIEQQLANPMFATIQQSAVAEAKKHGLDAMTAESRWAGDTASQVNAIENMMNRNVKGIVIDPANAYALNGLIKRARARGIYVVTTNTQIKPSDTANAAFETNNLHAGQLIGRWARSRLEGTPPKLALLNYDLTDQTSRQRHDGFLKGFGIGPHSKFIVGTALTKANVETGQQKMENLLSAHPDINAIYTINEPVAQGASLPIKRVGKQILVTSIDGSCSGVRSVQKGDIDATVMQFPTRMGRMAVNAIVNAVNTRHAPQGVHDTGTTLITNHPVKDVPSETAEWGLKHCWGQ